MKLLPIILIFVLIIPMTSMYAWGARGGTEDINIGIGELQESTGEPGISSDSGRTDMPDVSRGRPVRHKKDGNGELETNDDEEQTGILLPAIQKPRRTYGEKDSKKGGNVETEWKVEEGEK